MTPIKYDEADLVKRAKERYARSGGKEEPKQWLVQETQGHITIALARANRELLAYYEWHPKSNRLTRKGWIELAIAFDKWLERYDAERKGASDGSN